MAGCDKSELARSRFTDQFPTVPCFLDVDQLTDWHYNSDFSEIDCAYVAVPHFAYEGIIKSLTEVGIHILKEKPAALTEEEFHRCHQYADDNEVRLVTASPSRFSQRLLRLKEWLPFVGEPRFIESTRTLSCMNLGEGWRAEKSLSGGGAISDVGWHLLDSVIGLVTQHEPATPHVRHSELITTRPHQKYDVDDTAFVSLTIPHAGSKENVSCNLRVSRVGRKKVDEVVITGTDGTLAACGEQITLQIFLASGEKRLESHSRSEDSFRQLLQFFHREIHSPEPSEQYKIYTQQDLAVIQTIQRIYDANNTETIQLSGTPEEDCSTITCKHARPSPPKDLANCQFEWPIIDKQVEDAVHDQLHSSISIYGNSGVFETFEEEFKAFHDRSSWFALLHNSGSNALSALYFACGLRPGDKVIFPVFTFHATCSAAMHFGIRPVFVDAGFNSNGNICPVALEYTLQENPDTKAVVITHMWGVPCDMVALSAILKARPTPVLLLEDCSHAYGARVNGQPVGTFGDGAAWSLQGQKIISGGEGGVVLTRHREFHIRQLLWGHYNKRCKLEIPDDHPLKQFALTGSGPKNRVHPLAVRITLDQLRRMPEIRKFKALYAAKLVKDLGKIPFLIPPFIPSGSWDCDIRIEPAWYALTFRFKRHLAPPGLTRERFVRALTDRGLKDVDIPKSTGLLHKEPLFTHPHVLLPHVYPANAANVWTSEEDSLFWHADEQEKDCHGDWAYANAQEFYDEVIKIPVWADQRDETVVEHYIKVFKEVAAEFAGKDEP